MKDLREAALGSAAAALFAGVVLTALRWEPETATFPMLIGVTGLGLAVWSVVGDLLRKRPARLQDRGTSAEDTARARAALGWIAVFFALVLLIGFRWGLPLAVLVYYRLEARTGWVGAVAATVVSAAFLYVAVEFLYLPLYSGVLLEP